MTKGKKILFGFIALIFLPGVLSLIFNPGGHGTVSTTNQLPQQAPPVIAQTSDDIRGSAKMACSEMVEKQLDDQKSAEMDYFNDLPIKQEKPDQFKVQVSGRARNGFNALRRFVILCRVKREANGDWVLLKMEQVI